MPYYVIKSENERKREERRKQIEAEISERKREETIRNTTSQTLAGVFVDSKKAYEINSKSYVCGGVSVSWDLIRAGEEVFQGLRPPKGAFLGNGAFIEEAHAIYEKMTGNLITYNKNKGLDHEGKPLEIKKEGEEMEHNNFRSYLTTLEGIYRGASVEIEELISASEEAEAKYNKACEDASVSIDDKLILKAEALKAKRNLEEGQRALVGRVKDKEKELKEGLTSAVNRYYGTDPAKLDRNALELLKMGLMNTNDLINLANNNADNMTMLRVIGKYAGDSQDSEQRALALKLADITAGTKEVRAFEEISNIYAKALSVDKVERRVSKRLLTETDSIKELIEGVSDKPLSSVGKGANNEEV